MEILITAIKVFWKLFIKDGVKTWGKVRTWWLYEFGQVIRKKVIKDLNDEWAACLSLKTVTEWRKRNTLAIAHHVCVMGRATTPKHRWSHEVVVNIDDAESQNFKRHCMICGLEQTVNRKTNIRKNLLPNQENIDRPCSLSSLSPNSR